MSRLGAMHLIKHTGPKHTGSVIFFHGSGATGSHMKEWVELVSRNTFTFPHVNVLFPTAPLQPYAPAGGEMNNVWFDRVDIAPDVPELLESVDSLRPEVESIIQKENEAGIPTNRIVLGGFSMGGALTFHVAYRWNRDVAGAFAMSSFLNNESAVFDSLPTEPGLKLPPLLQLHGTADNLVPAAWGEATHTRLRASGVRGELRAQPRLGHSVDRGGVRAVKEWIDKLLPQV